MTIRTLVVVVALAGPTLVRAQGTATVARETAEYVARKFSREATEQGVETLARRIETLAVRHGDEAVQAVRRVGPRSLALIEEAGEHGLQSAKLLARYGDEAVWVASRPSRLGYFAKYGDDAARAMMRHGEIAEPLLASLGQPAAAALQAVTGQNGRRLAMLAAEGDIARIGRTTELLGVVAKFGDKAMEFVWKNKGALAVGAGLTAFLANPEPFLDGTADLAKIVAENGVKPLVEASGQVALVAARSVNWTVLSLALIGVLGLLFAVRGRRS